MRNAEKKRIISALEIVGNYTSKALKFLEEEDDNFKTNMDYTDFEQLSELVNQSKDELFNGVREKTIPDVKGGTTKGDTSTKEGKSKSGKATDPKGS